jgi:hypothetical protein
MLAIFAALFSGPVPVFDCSTCSLIMIGIGAWFSVGFLPGFLASAQLPLSLPATRKGVAIGFSIPCCTSVFEKLSVLFDRTMSGFVLTLSSFMPLPKPPLACASKEQREE